VVALGLERPHVAGLSFGGALALALSGRHPGLPRTLILASAYAGWRGSLPAATAEQRLHQARALAELPPAEFVDTLLPTMFSPATAPEAVDEFGQGMARAWTPSGFRSMAAASAENLRDLLPRVRVPTLLVYGDADERAPLAVAHDLHQAIPHSRLVVLSGVGHVCSVEAPEAFNGAVRPFLAESSV
jgi:pimeloyl-ACP methyl ester carboxylesterase